MVGENNKIDPTKKKHQDLAKTIEQLNSYKMKVLVNKAHEVLEENRKNLKIY